MPTRKKRKHDPGQPWERLSTEGVQAYAHFCYYRDMPYKDKKNMTRLQISRGRTLVKLAKELGASLDTEKKRSRRYNWTARAEAYDDYVERNLREENEAEIIRMNKLHANAGRQMAAKALRGLLSINENALSARDIVRMLDTGVKIERLARGQSTERQQIEGHVEQQHSGGVVTVAAPLNLKNLSDEELVSLERICSKIQPAEH